MQLQSLPRPTSLRSLRTLHQLAATYHQRPSQVVGVSDPLAAYVVDRAVLYAGLHVPETPKPMF